MKAKLEKTCEYSKSVKKTVLKQEIKLKTSPDKIKSHESKQPDKIKSHESKQPDKIKSHESKQPPLNKVNHLHKGTVSTSKSPYFAKTSNTKEPTRATKVSENNFVKCRKNTKVSSTKEKRAATVSADNSMKRRKDNTDKKTLIKIREN